MLACLSGFVFYTSSRCMYLRLYFSVSSQALTDHPFLSSPGTLQMGNRDASLQTYFFPRSSRAARKGVCELSLWRSLSRIFFDVFFLPDCILSCEHSDAGYYYLLAPTVCEIISVLAEALLQGVCISKNSVTKSLIIL